MIYVATFTGALFPNERIVQELGSPPAGDRLTMLTTAGLDADEDVRLYLQRFLDYCRDNGINLEVVVGQNVPVDGNPGLMELELALGELYGKPPLGESFVAVAEYDPDVIY